ncbi:MAG: S8 family peptidase [Fimbriimonadaceae bacterium]
MIRKVFIFALLSIAGLSSAQSDFVKNEVLVKFRPGVSFQKSVSIESLGAKVKSEISFIGWTVVRLPKGVPVMGAVEHFKTFSGVANAEPNYIRIPYFTPNDPMWASQYGPRKVKADLAWDMDQGSPAVVVAVLDTGVDLTHPDLQGKLVPGYDFSDGDSDPSDYDGHGTHTAGIVAAATNNGVGVAGTAFNCRVMPLKIFPNAIVTVVIAAVKYAADNGAKVASMSFGGAPPSQAEEDAMIYAFNKGTLLLASAGNDGGTGKNYPAGYNTVVAVAASDQNDNKAGFSTYGDWVEITAPGVDILSTYLGGGYANSSGTSMSCPMAAGVAALMFSRGGTTLTAPQARTILESTADPVGNYVTKGRVNAKKALEQVAPPVVLDFPATSISMYYGGIFDGDLSSVAISDDVRYQITSQFSNIGPAAAAAVTLNVTYPMNEMIWLKLVLEGKAIATSTNMIWLYNWQTGVYDYYRAQPYKVDDSVITLTISPVSKYVSSTGEVQLITRVSRSPRVRPMVNFTYGIDQIKLVGGFRS